MVELSAVVPSALELCTWLSWAEVVSLSYFLWIALSITLRRSLRGNPYWRWCWLRSVSTINLGSIPWNSWSSLLLIWCCYFVAVNLTQNNVWSLQPSSGGSSVHYGAQRRTDSPSQKEYLSSASFMANPKNNKQLKLIPFNPEETGAPLSYIS